MATTQRTTLFAQGWRIAAAVMVVALGLGLVPAPAFAAVTCPVPDTAADFDNDGLTDFQECDGIALRDGVRFETCTPVTDRKTCLDPNTKDLFVIVAPASQGSLLPAGFQPFEVNTAFGLTFNGLSALGITAHQVTPSQAADDRTVVGTQKAVMISESIDTSGSILGYCNWGSPNQLDGCTVFTRRIQDFVAATCAGRRIVDAAGATSSVEEASRAYIIRTFLHETGHSLGGLTAVYDSANGGYHYGPGTVMEQFATYSAKGKTCKFDISPEWNLTLDPPAVQLK